MRCEILNVSGLVCLVGVVDSECTAMTNGLVHFRQLGGRSRKHREQLSRTRRTEHIHGTPQYVCVHISAADCANVHPDRPAEQRTRALGFDETLPERNYPTRRAF
ncbi:hypothetical protein L226DRAFT_282427 [Lentinus tigrinus ALCF2SS1-7]|uniref:uncharacterized protein n=1 Tax=Lentinus tigrinus ALCF2SS1-7 TaxID=1328758 RepID=UPI0011661A71|nr:hypothetical protein L226DRAFT_282427 [Lentinus tigrinus ALCF2SS1-7]